jgi:ABC-type multidrug transport system ATPase subunit
LFKGAGKTSFLDIIAGKYKNGRVLGSVLVDGKVISSKRFALVSGFVDQEDMLIPTLTVRETLLFSANLRLPESVTRKEKWDIVEKTLDQLGILHIADSRIGGNGVRGLSGGEKRRVSIGIELVTSPSIILCDEPTSGLDSYNAHKIIEVCFSSKLNILDACKFSARFKQDCYIYNPSATLRYLYTFRRCSSPRKGTCCV